MVENKIEKKFLLIILWSVLLHAALFTLLQKLPAHKKQPLAEPIMVDLPDVPALKTVPLPEPLPARLPGEELQQMSGYGLPRGETLQETARPPQATVSQPPVVPGPPIDPRSGTRQNDRQASTFFPKEQLFRPKKQTPAADAIKLFPSADKMVELEESYRKKYGVEDVTDDSNILNDEILLASFSQRFVAALNSSLRYPTEALQLGLEGIILVKITFNRQGEIIFRGLLESSGSRILDDAAIKNIDFLGPIGPLPKNYKKETYSKVIIYYFWNKQGASRSFR